jgi:hypothetical protein
MVLAWAWPVAGSILARFDATPRLLLCPDRRRMPPSSGAALPTRDLMKLLAAGRPAAAFSPAAPEKREFFPRA